MRRCKGGGGGGGGGRGGGEGVRRGGVRVKRRVIFTSIKSNWVVSLDTLPTGHVFEMHCGEGNAFRFVQHFAVESSSCFVHPTTCQLRSLLPTTSLFVSLSPLPSYPRTLSPSLSVSSHTRIATKHDAIDSY